MSTLISDDMEPQTDLSGQGRTILRLLYYLKPHRKTLVFAFILLVLATAADVAGPICNRQVLLNKFR
ncbi:hypothetical protein AAC978_14970 [Desulfitobacterium sp. THU1]|uniref:hypothetical protein n=1 Tax=Desulfitobacterium sp. THU1 TaxID=3138072 RepID=UPI00311F090E